MPAALIQHGSGLIQDILVLVHVLDRFRIEAFQTHKHGATTRARQCLDSIRIGKRIEGDLRTPADPQGGKSGAKTLEIRELTANIVIDKTGKALLIRAHEER